MSKFKPNLNSQGRIIRGVLAIALLIGAFFVHRYSSLASVALVISGAFVMFEALRGWCVMRACGIKTKF